MNYKNLLHRVLLLISSPAKAWEEISLEEGRDQVASNFVYPMIGMCGLVVFVGKIVNMGFGNQCYEAAMMACASLFISLFGGFFLASSLVNWFGQRFLHRDSEPELCQQLVGYSMVVIFVLDILMGLFPEFRILQLLLQVYTLFIVWEGAQRIMHVQEDRMLTYTIVSSLFILVSPAAISTAFHLLSNLMH